MLLSHASTSNYLFLRLVNFLVTRTHLSQVEAERTEVLRLGAELNDLREAAEQDATAADEREAALKALLASETEVRSCAAATPDSEACMAFRFLPPREALADEPSKVVSVAYGTLGRIFHFSTLTVRAWCLVRALDGRSKVLLTGWCFRSFGRIFGTSTAKWHGVMLSSPFRSHATQTSTDFSPPQASRTEQVEVEDLLSLILAAQDAGSGGRGADEVR